MFNLIVRSFSVLLKTSMVTLAILGVAGLTGCGEAKPPKGYQPAAAVSTNGCPDLNGLFDLAAARQHSLLNEWLNLSPSEMATLSFNVPDNATRPLQYTAQMDVMDFLAKANHLRTSNPADYYHWRASTLAIVLYREKITL